jgi:hypothetical protein
MSTPVVQEVITIGYTETTFPPGTGTLASTTVTLTGSAAGNTTPVTASVPLGATSITVPLLPDTYAWSMQSVDSNGNNLGAAVTGTGVVSAPANVTINLPTGLTFA